MRRVVAVLGLAVVCTITFVLPATAAGPGRHPQGPDHGNRTDRSGRIEVMTRNLYVGADIFRVFDATSPDEVPLLVTDVLQTVFATDFPSRAEALADEIARYRPHLIGLQEAELLRVQSPGDFLIGNPQPAETVLFDYLDILLADLAARGLDYRAVAVVENADVEVPFVAGVVGGVPQLDDVRVTDRDVILARGDVATADALAANYSAALPVDLGFLSFDYLRGYTAVDATVHGRTVRFVNTHLETTAFTPLIQAAQAQELLALVADETVPVIVVGDFNSAPEDPFPSAYAQLAAAGFVDTWLRRLGRPESGLTCCFSETLDDPAAELTQRIDLVWARPGVGRPPFRDGVGPVRATVVGDALRDRTDGGLWPSDHAGVVSAMVLRTPR